MGEISEFLSEGNSNATEFYQLAMHAHGGGAEIVLGGIVPAVKSATWFEALAQRYGNDIADSLLTTFGRETLEKVVSSGNWKAVDNLANTGSKNIGATNTGAQITADNFFAGTRYTSKVLKQAASGDYHGFPESVDAFSGKGTLTQITGGDGITRWKLEIPGSYDGKIGTFEYIRNPDGTINHRLFVPK